MRRGTRPQGTELKVLLGAERFKPGTAEPELTAAPELSGVPNGLGDAGGLEYRRLYRELRQAGILMATDLVALSTYCYLFNEHETLKARAAEVGTDEAIRRGYMKAMAVLRAQMLKFGGELGLSPSSRRGVKRGQAKKQRTVAEKYLN